jgi:hypothetical protein
MNRFKKSLVLLLITIATGGSSLVARQIDAGCAVGCVNFGTTVWLQSGCWECGQAATLHCIAVEC